MKQHYDGSLTPDESKEAWASLPGFSKYLFSDMGRVKSFRRNTEGEILKPTWHGVRLYWVMEFLQDYSNTRVTKRVDAMIYEAFGGKPLIFHEQNLIYKNGDRTDMRYANLEMTTEKYDKRIEGWMQNVRKRRNKTQQNDCAEE